MCVCLLTYSPNGQVYAYIVYVSCKTYASIQVSSGSKYKYIYKIPISVHAHTCTVCLWAFMCLCLRAGAHCMSLSWCCRPLQCQILLSWQGDVRMVNKKKLQETAGSHNNFVPLEALPTGTPLRCPKSNPSMLSEMYHRIIWDSQLCDSTLNHGFYNLTNIYPLPTTQKRYPFVIIFNVNNQGSLERPVASSHGCGPQCRWNFGCCQR